MIWFQGCRISAMGATYWRDRRLTSVIFAYVPCGDCMSFGYITKGFLAIWSDAEKTVACGLSGVVFGEVERDK
ncbi:MAG: hypothetical protein BM562_09610 [Alphaproteobacteria bacterium MedPE-SWcel]|nr:MAG: hypothetical protein BM562_09610 [Alphaproteobacteria bacterium MedPE-SWcel]